MTLTAAEQDEFLAWLDSADRKAIEDQKKLLMRLNKAELLVLAKHFNIKHPEDYTEPRDWKYGGKEELAGEIAEIMVG